MKRKEFHEKLGLKGGISEDYALAVWSKVKLP